MNITLIARAGEDADCLELLRNTVAEWRRAGHDVRARATFEAGDAKRFASGARRWADLLVVAGGDGTLNEVANGLAARGSMRPRMAIVPMGTANDLAAGLGLPEDPEACLDVALHGRVQRVDVAMVNRHAFLNVSVGGMGATATRDATSTEKRFLGPIAYLLRGARAVAEATPVSGRFRLDGKEAFRGDFLFFAIGNGRRTGGGTEIAPDAETDDGRLDVVILTAVPKVELMRLLPEIRAGEHLADPAVFYRQARTVDIRLAESLAVNVDGEELEESRRLRYRDTRQHIEFMVPAG